MKMLVSEAGVVKYLGADVEDLATHFRVDDYLVSKHAETPLSVVPLTEVPVGYAPERLLYIDGVFSLNPLAPENIVDAAIDAYTLDLLEGGLL